MATWIALCALIVAGLSFWNAGRARKEVKEAREEHNRETWDRERAAILALLDAANATLMQLKTHLHEMQGRCESQPQPVQVLMHDDLEKIQGLLDQLATSHERYGNSKTKFSGYRRDDISLEQLIAAHAQIKGNVAVADALRRTADHISQYFDRRLEEAIEYSTGLHTR